MDVGRYTIVDEWGECVNLPIGLIAPRRAKQRREFIMLYQDGLLRIVDQRLTGEEMRVLLVILAFTDYENIIATTQAHIAERLGINPTAVSRAYSRLKKLSLIYESTTKGGVKQLRVSNEFGWRGSAQKMALVPPPQVKPIRYLCSACNVAIVAGKCPKCKSAFSSLEKT